MIEIRAACSPGEVRIAVTDHDLLRDAALWRPGAPDGLDDEHIVRVQTVAPALGGAFVTLVDGESGFLSTRMPHLQGALTAARISRSAQNGKGLRLRDIPLPDIMPGAPALLRRGPTPLDELAQRYPEAPIFIDSPAIAARLPSALHPRLTRCLTAFDPALDADFEALARPEADLGDLTASIFPTPALIAIDLDSARNPDFKTNTACFPALARQIRLRNLSGTILIDPAGVKTRKRQALVPFLSEAVASDPVRTEVLGTTPSGLIEIARQRRRPPMHELLLSAHGTALSALRQILRDGRKGATLTAAIPVICALEQDSDARDAFMLATGRTLHLMIDPDAPLSRWSLS